LVLGQEVKPKLVERERETMGRTEQVTNGEKGEFIRGGKMGRVGIQEMLQS
jgi:hypothetical protein